jgi:hypothetical protein
MKNKNKIIIRGFILDQLFNADRLILHELAEKNDLDPLEVMEFYLQQVSRIDKMFDYPNTDFLLAIADELGLNG